MSFKNNIVVFGCKSTTKFLCEFLISIGKLKCIITIDEGLAKKNDVADYYSLSDFALKNDIQIYFAKSYSLNDNHDLSFCNKLGIDLAFVIGWQRLIPKPILSSIKIGAFGMHGSSLNLPLGRGRSPMNWALIEGRKVFYTNLFRYDEGVDSGNILDYYKFSITSKDNAETMHFKNILAMKYLVAKNLESLLENNFILKPQLNITPTYYPKRNPIDSIINWNDDVYNIERFIRAVSYPFNGAFTFINSSKLIIKSAQVFDIQDFGYDEFRAGTVVEIFFPNKLLVKGFGGLLLINEFKSECKVYKLDIFGNNNFLLKNFKLNAERGFDNKDD